MMMMIIALQTSHASTRRASCLLVHALIALKLVKVVGETATLEVARITRRQIILKPNFFVSRAGMKAENSMLRTYVRMAKGIKELLAFFAFNFYAKRHTQNLIFFPHLHVVVVVFRVGCQRQMRVMAK
jgi:hypothetical protein